MADIQVAVQEVKAMARVAATLSVPPSTANSEEVRHAHEVFVVLFDQLGREDARTRVQNKFKDLSTTVDSDLITIFCSGKHVQAIRDPERFGWECVLSNCTKPGINSLPCDPECQGSSLLYYTDTAASDHQITWPLPRVEDDISCNDPDIFAYTYNVASDPRDRIIICPQLFDSNGPLHVTNSLSLAPFRDITQATKNSIDSYRTLAPTLLHELMHTRVAGPPAVDYAYTWTDCAQLAQTYDYDVGSSWNADTYAMYALGK